MKKFFVILLLPLFYSIISCSQEISSSGTDNSLYLLKNLSSANSQAFSVLTTSENNQISFSDTIETRTIRPDGISINELDLYLFGQNKINGKELTFSSNGVTTNCLKVSVTKYSDDGTSGTFEINLGSGIYSLTLAAVKAGYSFDKSNLAQNTILIGNATADPSVDTIFFCLSGKRFMNATGMYSTARLGLYTLGWAYTDYNDSSSSFACDVGIYKKNLSNTKVYEIKDFLLPHYDSVSDVPDTVDSFPETFICTSIPGEYNFTVHFYDKNNPNRSAYYSDTILLLGNQTTEKILEIPEVIGSKPAAPSSMVCGYIDPSDLDSEKYMLDVEWTDNAKNEEYFRLEIMEIDGDEDAAISSTYEEYIKGILGKSTVHALSARDALWASLATTFEVISIENDYFEQMGMVSSNQVRGSLSRNSNTVIFPVLLGRRYLLRMCAVNSEGVSEYVYPDIFAGSYRNINAAHWVWDDSDYDNCNLCINRYKIAYMLNNGNFYDDSSSEVVTPYISLDKVSYQSQTKAGSTLLNPVSVSYTNPTNSSVGTASLKYSTYGWNSWNISSASGVELVNSATVSSYRYKGYKGMYLYSSYGVPTQGGSELSVYNTDNSKYGVPYSKICLMPSASGELSLSPLAVSTSYEVTVSKSTYQTLHVTVQDEFYSTKVTLTKLGSHSDEIQGAFATTNDWTLTEFDAGGNPSNSQVSVSHLCWPIDLSKYTAGKYFITINAQKYKISDPGTILIFLNITE